MYLYPNRHSVIMIMIPLKSVFIDLIYYCESSLLKYILPVNFLL